LEQLRVPFINNIIMVCVVVEQLYHKLLCTTLWFSFLYDLIPKLHYVTSFHRHLHLRVWNKYALRDLPLPPLQFIWVYNEITRNFTSSYSVQYNENCRNLRSFDFMANEGRIMNDTTTRVLLNCCNVNMQRRMHFKLKSLHKSL